MYPGDLKYTKSHEWARVTDETAVVGVSEFAQEELGDIVNVELPAPGTKVQAGEPFGSVDSVKAVSDLMSPVSGEVVEVNEDLESSPELINQDPYGTGWMIKVKLDGSSLDELMTNDQYEQFVEAE